MGPKSTETAAALYEVIAQKGVIKTTNPTVAETSKLFEGIYRDINIALANELGRFCGAIGIDFQEVREAANSQPFCHLPGFVGGWCIPFYPHFVMQIADEKGTELPLTKLARTINENRPQLIVKVANSALRQINPKGLKGSQAAILGLAFRADVADTRNSPSYEVIDLLLKEGVSRMTAFDPYVTHDQNLEKKGIQIATDVEGTTRNVDLVVVMTDHSTFKNSLTPELLLRLASTPSILIDGRDVFLGDSSQATNNLLESRVEGFHIFTRLQKEKSPDRH